MPRGLVAEWSLLCLATCLLTIAVTFAPLGQRGDDFVYDLASRALLDRAAPSDDVLIVAIDNRSIEALGPWPWPRAQLARLVDTIARQRPRTIVLDILLPESRPGDAALAGAIGRAGNVILPIGVETPGPNGAPFALTPPNMELAKAARLLGHVSVMPDRDGIVRAIDRAIDYRGRPIQHLAVATARQFPAGHPAFSHPAPAARERLRFHVPADEFNAVPAVAVLRGEVPAAFFPGRDVLVGSMASGLGDTYATPIGSNRQNLAGVELLGNALLAERRGDWIALADAPRVAAVSVLALILLCLAFLRLGPTAIVAASALSLVGIATAALFGLSRGVWISPTPIAIGIVFAATMWTWRRLQFVEAAIDFGLRWLGSATRPARISAVSLLRDPLEERVTLLQQGLTAIRQSQLSLGDLVRSLPEPTFRVARDGEITLFNAAFQRLFADLGAALPTQVTALGETLLAAVPALREVHAGPVVLTDQGLAIPQPEVCDRLGRWYIVAAEQLGAREGWVVSLSDVTQVRRMTLAQRRSLQFLSHDLRAPIAASIATIDRLVSDTPSALDRRLAETRARLFDALKMADDHVALTKAEARPAQLDQFDLAGCVQEAIDRVSHVAAGKEVRIVEDWPETGCFEVTADRSELSRAISNLVLNAIIHGSQAGDEVTVRLEKSDSTIRLVVADRHAASLPALQRALGDFHEYGQLAPTGLGLAYCSTVLRKLGAPINVVANKSGKAAVVLFSL